MTLGGGYFTIDFKYGISNGVIAFNFVNKNFSMNVYAADSTSNNVHRLLEVAPK